MADLLAVSWSGLSGLVLDWCSWCLFGGGFGVFVWLVLGFLVSAWWFLFVLGLVVWLLV